MVKVSIIVPVYNKFEYLEKCLDSLINQTLKNIEIICVDDKSTDNSLDILFLYAKKDDRIKVYPQEKNRGLSATRNVGMKAASGEFIAFVDADDFVDKDFYEKLYDVSNSYDVVKGEIWEYDEKINRCVISDISRANEKIKETGNPLYFYYGITSAIFRREFILLNNLSFFENLYYNEDTVFILSVTTKINKIKIVDNAKYYYRFVPGSLSRTFNDRVIESLYLSTMMTIRQIAECNLSLENMSIIFDYLFTLLSFFVNSTMLDYKQINGIKKEYFKCIKEDKNEKQNSVKVSIIVPIHNGEQYLRRALFCLTLQTLYDIEIICVNDGSTDNSINILKEFAKEDERIKIIDCEKNGGQSKARNIGIKEASGEYIAFMDCDDQIDLLFYKKLYESAKKNNADISKGNVIEIDHNGEPHQILVNPVEKNPFYFCNNFCTGIFRKSLIIDNKITFPEGFSLGEDLKFLFDAVSHANKVALVWNVFYYYIRHIGSEDPEITPLYKIETVIKAFKYIISKVENFDFYKKDIELYITYYLMYINYMTKKIAKCEDKRGKILCIDFIFELYNSCTAKDDIIKKVQVINPFLADAFKNNDKNFYEKLVINDHLSDIFYQKNTVSLKESIPCCIITAYSNKKTIDNTIISNEFLKREKKLAYNLIDSINLDANISSIFNSFIHNYDYNNDTWFIFIKPGFEFLTFPSKILECLDKDKIYGPIGSKAYFDQYKVGYAFKGKAYKKDLWYNFHDSYNKKYFDPSVDTLDSMCLIVHSSLIKKYNLCFDENLHADLYVEDFCINATEKHDIKVESISFECAYYSSEVDATKNAQFLKQLEYLNKKYPNELYGGVISPIGGKILPCMSDAEFSMYKIRYEIKNKVRF